MLGQIPLFVWPAILGLVGLDFAFFMIFAARKLRLRRLRQYHAWTAAVSLILVTIHALWALTIVF